MKHKHCEVIKAWADGEKIQYKQVAWASEDDINIAIAEMNDEATRQGL